MRYPIAIETGSADTAYGVVVPDLPGCFSAGDTLDEALKNTEDAILLYLEDMVEDGKAPPIPSSLETVGHNPAYQGWTLAVVNADMSKLSTKAVRVNITVPDRVLSAIDSFVDSHGETRSGFLTRAALEVIHQEAV